MIADKKFMQELWERHEDLRPDCGAREATIEAFLDWFNAHTAQLNDYDIISIVDCFNEDLIEFGTGGME